MIRPYRGRLTVQMATTTPIEVHREGGAWLVAARAFMADRAANGSKLMPGSGELVNGLVVLDIERIAAIAVAADRNERGR